MLDYEFLDYYYKLYNNDPLYILNINEQFALIRQSFKMLDEEAKNILTFFIIQNNRLSNFEIEKYLKKLRNNYLRLSRKAK